MTDRNLKNQNLGGGGAYREGDRHSHGFPLLGLHTSLTSKAGALLQLINETDNGKAFTIFINSLALIQNIQ